MKEVILFGFFYLIFAVIISLIFYLIFGLEWFLTYSFFYILFILYPLVLGVFFLWIIFIRKKEIKEFISLKVRIPDKGHRWIYSIIFILILIIIITHVILLWLGIIYLNPIMADLWLYLIPSVIFGPIIELESFMMAQRAAEVIQQHHESWDGSGYPLGLRGEEIFPEARVLHVCDVYDALVNDRPYRKAYSHQDALDIIRAGMKTEYDPDAAAVLLEVSEQLKRAA